MIRTIIDLINNIEENKDNRKLWELLENYNEGFNHNEGLTDVLDILEYITNSPKY